MKSLFQLTHKSVLMTFKIAVSSLAFLVMMPHQKSFAQVYDQLYWSAFFKDATGWPSFNWSKKELVDGIAIGGVQPRTYNIYIVGEVMGSTGTMTICDTNSFTYGGTSGGDAMVSSYTKGGHLNWSSYLGNNSTVEYAHCVAVDKILVGPGPNWHDYVYVAGEVRNNGALSIPGSFVCSSDCPSFTTTDDDTAGSGGVAFIAKYNGSNGELMSWRYFGGNPLSSHIDRQDQILGIAINPVNHHVVVSGYTTTDGLAATATYPGWDTQLDSGNPNETDGGDGFVAEFDECLQNLLFFTYIGGTGQDRCHDIKFDNSGNIIVSGTVESTGLSYAKTGYNIYQAAKKSKSDVLLAKLGPVAGGGYERLFATYLGGDKNDRGRRIAVDSNDNIFITGSTYSPNFPTLNPHQSTLGGGRYDAFVSKFDSTGNLNWSTFLGGSSDDKANDIVISPIDNAVYVAGQTNSANLWQNISPGYTSSIQNTLNGNGTTMVDGFIVGLNDVTGPNQGTIVFGTFLGGSKQEDDDKTKSYSPSLAIGGNNELLFAEDTKSANIGTVTNPTNLVGSYSGSYDIYFGLFRYHPNPYGWKTEDYTQSNPNDYLLLYPNPANSFVTLSINTETLCAASIFLINTIGQRIPLPGKNLIAGNNDLEFDLSGLPNGVYVLEIVTPNEIQNGILVKE